MLRFAYPVPADSKISQRFNKRPFFYGELGFRGHPGVDFAVPTNTPVAAAFWGEVIEMAWSKKGWGVYLKVKHGDLVSIYAHLDRIKVVRGCYITQGQTLGYSGNSGLSSGPHLHFGILDQKKLNNGYKGYIDPMPFLKKIKTNFTNKGKRIQAEIDQIRKDGYTKESMYIHTKYIEKILGT